MTGIARSLGGMVGASLLPQLIRDALAVEPVRITGTIADVGHIVVLMQENRSFDHYFGAMRGVRGFADRFQIPTLQGSIRPFHLDTQANFALMRAEGTPHTWRDAQAAWNHGRMDQWTQHKGAHSVGYYRAADLPFQYALADAFTVCDAYHCSFHGGTNPNRLFLWTGTNDSAAKANGPALYNELDTLAVKPGIPAYAWTTYPERLQAAGIRWQIYQDMADNYDDNPLVGFQAYRDAAAGVAGADEALKRRALSTRTLSQLRADVEANALPQISWIIAPAKDSEHPEMSSPAQGAHFTAQVLEALTSNKAVWSQTVLFANFDENDGYFDHLPPPAVPSGGSDTGASTVDTRGEYHDHLKSYHKSELERDYLHRPYGLGMRVPMLVISPWSRGGWVNSQVFDHTSVIRFMEQRFGVVEPNISPWRRAVCGDLTSAFDFAKPNTSALPTLPATHAQATRAANLPARVMPLIPSHPPTPIQNRGSRPSRALPYVLHVGAQVDAAKSCVELHFANEGAVAAVFHVYDRQNPAQIPRRYTVGAGKRLSGCWNTRTAYDLWVLAPNGFHRHFVGAMQDALAVQLRYQPTKNRLLLQIISTSKAPHTIQIRDQAYGARAVQKRAEAGQTIQLAWDVSHSQGWYDLQISSPQLPAFAHRLAGRMETGHDSVSDPAWSDSRSL